MGGQRLGAAGTVEHIENPEQRIADIIAARSGLRLLPSQVRDIIARNDWRVLQAAAHQIHRQMSTQS